MWTNGCRLWSAISVNLAVCQSREWHCQVLSQKKQDAYTANLKSVFRVLVLNQTCKSFLFVFFSKFNPKLQGNMPPELESNLSDATRYPGNLEIIEDQIEDKALTNLESIQAVDGKDSPGVKVLNFQLEERVTVKKPTNF